MHRNRKVKILSQEKNRISIAPFEPQEESVSLASLKREIAAQCEPPRVSWRVFYL